MFTFCIHISSPVRRKHKAFKNAKRQASLPTGPLVRFSDITTEYNSTY